MSKLLVILLMAALCAGSAHAYGPPGHALVGAIADKRLATSSAAVKQNLALLLDGMTLQQAATLPDSIKTWDKNPKGFTVTGHKKIDTQLRAFVAANPATGSPSHHEFHYTDVPVFGSEKYASGDVGRSPFDIVHMIPFCIRVVKGTEPETNDRKITKPVAVILLAHYLADIHQPLHVGAEYFDSSRKPFEPSASDKGFADQGGNKLTLFTLAKGKEVSAGVFHGYWDNQTVSHAFNQGSTATMAKTLAKNEPAGWKLSGGVETWAEQMADEIMPIAREAHERLNFTSIKEKPGHADIDSGNAKEKKQGTRYANWSRDVVKGEIPKAGWRLAALLDDILQ